MDEDKIKEIEVFVSGRVQGVFFRQQTKEEALKLSLSGWVKNEEDGRVKIVAEGQKEKLEQFILWVKKGPPYAKVKEVVVKWQKAEGMTSFEIKY